MGLVIPQKKMVRIIFAVKQESLKWLCNMKIKGRNFGRNQEKLFSTGFPNIVDRLRHCDDT